MSIARIELPGGLSCSALGFGTMGLGGKFERDTSHDDDAIKVIHGALDLGINLFDTAEIYGAGHSEEVLGMALYDRRSKAIIATKFNPSNSSATAMIAACEASLKRLGTDVIDLYQTHWPSPAVPLEDMAAGFLRLFRSGKIRAIGFSNATASLMRKVTELLPEDFPIATSQQEYNLSERFVERAVLPFCQSHEMSLLAYSPLAQGKLMTGATGLILNDLAILYKTTPATLALQWLMHQARTIPIPMTSKLSHLESNVAAALQPLPAEALMAVGNAFKPDVRDISVTAIQVAGSISGKSYFNLEDARANSLKLSPSPVELATELMDGEMLKPVKVRLKADEPERYELYEGQLRYWAWRIAHNDQLPIPALVA